MVNAPGSSSLEIEHERTKPSPYRYCSGGPVLSPLPTLEDA